jgi:uroporphyrinogen-III synthase
LQLYLGLDPKDFPTALHYPVIRTELILSDRLQEALSLLSQFTHFIFTSKRCVSHWFEVGTFDHAVALAIGKATASSLRSKGVIPLVSDIETQEGVIELLKTLDLQNGYLFYPHSKRARPLLANHLRASQLRFFSLDLYDTLLQRPEPVPSLENIDEIIFTSPSTVEGFLQIFGKVPQDKKLTCIGAITQNALYQNNLKNRQPESLSADSDFVAF